MANFMTISKSHGFGVIFALNRCFSVVFFFFILGSVAIVEKNNTIFDHVGHSAYDFFAPLCSITCTKISFCSAVWRMFYIYCILHFSYDNQESLWPLLSLIQIVLAIVSPYTIAGTGYSRVPSKGIEKYDALLMGLNLK